MTAPTHDPVVARLLAAVQAGDPVSSGPDRGPESAVALDALIDHIVAVSPTVASAAVSVRTPAEAARRRRRRRRRLAGGALAVAALSIGSGVAARVLGRSVDNAAAPVLCQADAVPGGSAAVVDPSGDPVAACRRAWENGVFETATVSFETLTACVSSAGIVEVYPAGSTICTELGLSRYEGPDEAALAIGELQDRLIAVTDDQCEPAEEVEALAVELIEELGLTTDGWSVVRRPPVSPDAVCSGIGVDPSIRQVFVVPLPKNP